VSRSSALLLSLWSLVAGCGGSSSGGVIAPIGPLTVQPAVFVGDGTLTLIDDGGAVPLVVPPQGGHVILIGAIIGGVPAGADVGLRARLRDATTNDIVAEDGRTVVTRAIEGDASHVATDPQSMAEVANVAPCPNYGTKDIDGVAYVLEVELSYGDPSVSVAASRTVTPACPTEGPDAPVCTCECAAGYTLGKCPPSVGGG
jgi:hypothetical protein